MIKIRGHYKKDIPWRVKWLNNESATKYAIDKPHHVTSPEEQIKWFNDYKKTPKKKFFTICDNRSPIGFMGLSNIDKERKTASVFIMIGEQSYYGKGIGKRAMIFLVNYAFEKLRLRKLTLDVDKKNLRAVNLYKKIGFKIVGKTIKELKMNLSVDFTYNFA